MSRRYLLHLLFLSTSFPGVTNAQVSSIPGKLALERPTLKCLGVYWTVRGDANRNARIMFEYRKTGEKEWHRGLDIFRVEPSALQGPKAIPPGTHLFAGSIFDLDEDTEYALRLTLEDPDGGGVTKMLHARTRAVPKPFRLGRKLHVVPGDGGGNGSSARPFRGLPAADNAARPGDTFWVHKGLYKGTWTVRTSGLPGKPIVWRGGVDGEAIIDARGTAEKRPERAISASDLHDVHFIGLTIRNAKFLMVCHRSKRIVVRKCSFYGCDYGFTCTNNRGGKITDDFYIADNIMRGPSTWPRSKGIENARGIQVTGRGHAICYNRIIGFADAIDTFRGPECSAIDIYNNEISEMTDDGIEMDYSQRNTRCFRNRLTNVFQGISVEPVFDGPVYIFRNVMYNVALESFKMHNSPSGALMFHNTSVKSGMPLVLYTSEPVRNCVYRNNLFIGTQGNYAYETTAPMRNCDFDYDGFGGGPWRLFMKWDRVRYKTINEVRKRAPAERHAVIVSVTNCFDSRILPPTDPKKQFPPSINDLRLSRLSQAIDRGVVLPNINDGFKGKAPDLGAFELGDPLPHYGPGE